MSIKKSVVIILCTFLIINPLIFYTTVADGPLFEITIYVDDDNTEGPWDGSALYPFQTIHDAVDFAIDGDVILVRNGYYEGSVKISKSIILHGNSQYGTIIDGMDEEYSSAIEVSADNVGIYRCTIQNGHYGGIDIYGSNINVSQTICKNNGFEQICIRGSSKVSIINNIIETNDNTEGIRASMSEEITIMNNEIYNGDGRGIDCVYVDHGLIAHNSISEIGSTAIKLSECSDIQVMENELVNNGGTGIYFSEVDYSLCYNNQIQNNVRNGILVDDNSNTCTIALNTIQGTTYYSGIQLEDMENCLIINNIISGFDDAGLKINGDGCRICGNEFSENEYGIYSSNTNGNVFDYNIIRDNIEVGIKLDNDHQGFFHHNTFVASSSDHVDDGSLDSSWDDGEEGNYWDNYEGEDADENGIGDTPYPIPPSGLREDSFPLMNPPSSLQPLEISYETPVEIEQSFEVLVASVGQPIPNAKVRFLNQTFTTNAQGKVTVTAPSAATSIIKCITAWKEGYVFTATLISIQKIIDIYSLPKIDLEAPTTVVQGESFSLRATSQGIPIHHCFMYIFVGNSSFDNCHLSNEDGVVTITAPHVIRDTICHVHAMRDGYYPNITEITILKDAPVILHFSAVKPSSVVEKQPFTITVKTQETGQIITDAKVQFDGQTKYTDLFGQVTFTAPSVYEDSSSSIIISHGGYEQYLGSILVVNEVEGVSIHLLSPNGKESWSGTQTIQWRLSSSHSLDNYAISIQYQYAYGLWNTIIDSRIDVITPYPWDTTTVSDGYPYRIKVILKKDDDLDGIFEQTVASDTSDFPFGIDNSAASQGLITGWISGNTTGGLIPVENAQVCIILSTIDKVITSKCTFSNGMGWYEFPMSAGVYTLIVYKRGFHSQSIDNVSVWANETTLVNVTLEEGTDETGGLFFIDEYRELIDEAIKGEQVGGEITIETLDEQQVLIYDSVMLQPYELQGGKITLLINGDELSAGRTVVINLGEQVVNVENTLEILYDDEPITLADDILDILNPNNDGLHAEYLLTIGTEGMQILVSIPHFSEHTLSIVSLSELVEEVGGIEVFLTYLFILIAFAVLTALPIIRLWRKIE